MRYRKIIVSLLCSTAIPATAASTLSEDRGAAGLYQALKRLQTNARVLYITAHPDDEDGGCLTLLSRGLGADVTLLSLTRGEAGANLITSDFFDSLGALRTLELLKAAQYYGVRVRFTTFTDYGYSKNVEEAWRNWDREKLLADVVRIVRLEKPHVILTRWQGTSRDGHGHHTAAGIMAQLAFEAAGDPQRFPEQIAAGLEAWQPLKLYTNNRRENEDWTIRVDSGAYDPLLGRTYAQMAREGLRWQRSQGAGAVMARPGPSFSYYKLLGSQAGTAMRESSFFERIERNLAPASEIARHARAALNAFDPLQPSEAARHLAAGFRAVRSSLGRSGDQPSERKLRQFQEALALSLGLELEAQVRPDQPVTGMPALFRPFTTFRLATHGQCFDVDVVFHRPAEQGVELLRLELIAPPGWSPRQEGSGKFTVCVPAQAAATQAFWQRDSVRQMTYRLDSAEWFGHPLPPPPLLARATYRLEGVEATLDSEVQTSRIDSLGLQHYRNLAIGPKLSVEFAGGFGVMPLSRNQYEARIAVRNLGKEPVETDLRLGLPSGWVSEPGHVSVRLDREDEESRVTFRLMSPAGTPAGDYSLEAVASAGGLMYHGGFVAHTYPGLETLYLSRPAIHTVRRVDVQVAAPLRVGYVMGTGDNVPDTLSQLGVDFDLLDSATLATGELSRYDTILLGIRTYAARSDVKTHNPRLLEYVRNGGVLIVQYNTPEFDNNYGPFPYKMGNNPEEVSEEGSPMTILAPQDPVFRRPNLISSRDFDGWIEQRGSKFLAEWDARYKPLLETRDTGQTPQRGGWVVAPYGEGLYIYCAYAWYRQLPFAVPGAVRLFADLISLGARTKQGRTAGL